MKKILIALISTFLFFSSTAWATTYFEDGGTYNIDYLIGDYVRVDWNQPLTPTTVNVESGASLARITSYNQGVVRPGKVAYFSGCESRPGRLASHRVASPWIDGSNPRD